MLAIEPGFSALARLWAIAGKANNASVGELRIISHNVSLLLELGVGSAHRARTAQAYSRAAVFSAPRKILGFAGTENCFSVAVHHKNTVILSGNIAVLKILSAFIFCAFKYT